MKYVTLFCLCVVLFACNGPGKNAQSQEPAKKPELLAEKKPSVIMFYANWCGYCKKMFPAFQTLQEKYNKEINFFYIDIDSARGAELARQYRTKQGGVPDTQFYDNAGNLVDEQLGAMPTEQLSAKVQSLIKVK